MTSLAMKKAQLANREDKQTVSQIDNIVKITGDTTLGTI